MPKAIDKPTTPRRRQKLAETYASLTFSPVKFDQGEADVSLSEWLARAQQEYTVFRTATAALEKDDVDLAAFVEKAGGEAILAFIDVLADTEKTYRAGIKVTKSVQIRLLASMSRAFLPTEAQA